MATARVRLTQHAWLRPLATLLFVVVLATVFSPREAGAPIFWRADNLANVLRQISDIGILAMGMTLVIISGGIDLSVGSLLALSCTIFAFAFTRIASAGGPAGAGAVFVSKVNDFVRGLDGAIDRVAAPASEG